MLFCLANQKQRYIHWNVCCIIIIMIQCRQSDRNPMHHWFHIKFEWVRMKMANCFLSLILSFVESICVENCIAWKSFWSMGNFSVWILKPFLDKLLGHTTTPMDNQYFYAENIQYYQGAVFCESIRQKLVTDCDMQIFISAQSTIDFFLSINCFQI